MGAQTLGNGDTDTGGLDTEALGDIEPLSEGDIGAGTPARGHGHGVGRGRGDTPAGTQEFGGLSCCHPRLSRVPACSVSPPVPCPCPPEVQQVRGHCPTWQEPPDILCPPILCPPQPYPRPRAMTQPPPVK